MEQGEGEEYQQHFFVHISNNVSYTDPVLEVIIRIILFSFIRTVKNNDVDFSDLSNKKIVSCTIHTVLFNLCLIKD